MPLGSRQNQARVTVVVDGISLGLFEDRTGGDADSADTQYPLGGMGPRISLGGRQEVANVVVKCLYDTERQSRIKWLVGRAGKGQMVVTEQPLDNEEQAFGEPLVWSGTLKRVQPPERQADSDAAAQLELEMSVSGQIG
jgi:hypothetical protein